MSSESEGIWNSGAEADLLAGRAEGFWNLDYFERVLLPLLNLPPGARVLDVGAGNGALTFLLARLRPDLELTGLDLTDALVAAGNEAVATRGLANVRFTQGDALRLPFADASCDATVCQTLLVHLADASSAVREMSRVLRPGGAFMAAEYHTLNFALPVDSATEPLDDVADTARYAGLVLRGYRQSGQGDLQVGGRVPFLAADAGLDVVDCRINDRVTHAFPPYRRASDQASLAELRSWAALLEDSGYRAWVEGAVLAGGGTAQDVAGVLGLFSDRVRRGFGRSDYAFLWLINPVLLVTVARKLDAVRAPRAV
jgi:SAM-dependent methyltransferase